MKKDTFYFPHDYNARNDLRTQALLFTHGAAGYGIYWCIIEILHEESGHSLKYSELTWTSIARQMSTSVEQVLTVVDACIELELFERQGDAVISVRVLENIEHREYIRGQRSKAGKRSASVRQMSTSVEQNPTKERKEKERKENNSKESKRRVFKPPTQLEVKQYCKERNNTVNVNKWMAHYEANGWMVGKNKMKDWKAAVRTWENNEFDVDVKHPKMHDRTKTEGPPPGFGIPSETATGMPDWFKKNKIGQE